MAWIAAVASGSAKAIQTYQQIKLKREEAKGFRDAKNRSMAATTRELAEEQRNKEFMHSRALAIAAASGAGVDDPGMVKVLADLNAEGEYRIMSKLWRGQDEAAGLIFRAEAAEREADSIFNAGVINVVSSAMSAYGGSGGFGGGSATASASSGSASFPGGGPSI